MITNNTFVNIYGNIVKSIAFLVLIVGLVSQPIAHAAISTQNAPIRVLSLDGGGVRGVLEAYYLMQIEAAAGKPIHELFDLIAGTSTGGIIALGLTIPNDEGVPSFSAESLYNLYTKKGKSIFQRAFWSFFGLFGAKYKAKGLEEELVKYFKDKKLSSALTGVLITSYSANHESGVLFSSMNAKHMPAFWDFPAWQVARATSAAPTFFEPFAMEFPLASGVVHNLVDGGLYRNNPAMLAYLEAKEQFPNRDIEVYSLGTGRAEKPLKPGSSNSTLFLISPILHHIFVGISQADSEALHRILNSTDANGSKRQNYFRINTRLQAGKDGLDDVSVENIKYLTKKARKVVQTTQFKEMVARLLGKENGSFGFPLREDGLNLFTLDEQPNESFVLVPEAIS